MQTALAAIRRDGEIEVLGGHQVISLLLGAAKLQSTPGAESPLVEPGSTVWSDEWAAEYVGL